MLKFERLEVEGLVQYIAVYRAKVPGGWLMVVNQSEGTGTTFVADPEHRWDGSSLP